MDILLLLGHQMINIMLVYEHITPTRLFRQLALPSWKEVYEKFGLKIVKMKTMKQVKRPKEQHEQQKQRFFNFYRVLQDILAC